MAEGIRGEMTWLRRIVSRLKMLDLLDMPEFSMGTFLCRRCLDVYEKRPHRCPDSAWQPSASESRCISSLREEAASADIH